MFRKTLVVATVVAVAGFVVGPAAAVSTTKNVSHDGCSAKLYNSDGFADTPIAYTSRNSGNCNLRTRIFFKEDGLTKNRWGGWHHSYAEVLADEDTALYSSTHYLDGPQTPVASKAFGLSPA